MDSIPGGHTVAETNDKGADSRYARRIRVPAFLPRPEEWLGNCPPGGDYSEAVFGANYPCNYRPYNPDLPALAGRIRTIYRDFYSVGGWTGEGEEAWIESAPIRTSTQKE